MSKGKTKKQEHPPTDKSGLWGWGLVAAAVIIFMAIILWPDGKKEFSAKIPETGHGNLAMGKRIFAAQCAVCHGKEAVGEDPAQPRGGMKAGGIPLAPALNGTGHAWHHSPDLLFKNIKEGSPAKGSPMVGFGGRLSDQDIINVIAYIQSLWPKEIMEKYKQAFLKGQQ